MYATPSLLVVGCMGPVYNGVPCCDVSLVVFGGRITMAAYEFVCNHVVACTSHIDVIPVVSSTGHVYNLVP